MDEERFSLLHHHYFRWWRDSSSAPLLLHLSFFSFFLPLYLRKEERKRGNDKEEDEIGEERSNKIKVMRMERGGGEKKRKWRVFEGNCHSNGNEHVLPHVSRNISKFCILSKRECFVLFLKCLSSPPRLGSLIPLFWCLLFQKKRERERQ